MKIRGLLGRRQPQDRRAVEPRWGRTRSGLAVHAHVMDHHPAVTRTQRFNKACAMWLTRHAGSMGAFWLFWLLCLTILPSCLHEMGVIGSKWILPSFLLGFGFNLLMTWFNSTCLELVLMPAIMVGQSLQNEAGDARAAKQFEDTEVVMDRLDTATQGGLTEVLEAVKALDHRVTELAASMTPASGGSTS